MGFLRGSDSVRPLVAMARTRGGDLGEVLVRDDSSQVLERAEELLRREGFIYAAADCRTLREQIFERNVATLGELILQAQRSFLSEPSA
jgi:hypothetical protein